MDRLKIIPSGLDVARHELITRRGIPAAAVTVAVGDQRTDWGRARAVRAWLQDHPDARVVVLVDRLASRRKRLVLHSVLGADAARMSVRALAHPWYDETNWWRRKEGVVDVSNDLLGLAYASLFGESRDFGDADPERLPEADR